MDRRKKILMLGLMMMFLATTVYAACGDLERQKQFPCMICDFICTFFKILYFLVTLIAMIFIVLAGIQWASAGDDVEARNKAKSKIIYAVVAIVVVAIAGYLIWWLVNSFIGAGFGTTPTAGLADPLQFITGSCDTMCTEWARNL